MAIRSSGNPAQSRDWLYGLCASRTLVCLAFAMYAGALPGLIAARQMSASEAGAVQTAFNRAYGASLVLTGWLSDRVGARRVFLWSSVTAAAAGLPVVVGGLIAALAALLLPAPARAASAGARD